MKRFMKLMAAMLGAVMVLSSLAACTTPAPTTAPTTAPTAAPTKAPTVSPTDAPTDAPTEEPTEATGIPPKYGKKVREKGVITVGVPRNSGVEDYETNDWTLWLEEVTGLDIQFEYFSSAAADYRSQLATRIADFQHEELPDILWGFNLTESTIHDYGEDGFLFDLTPYYEDKEKSKDFWDQLAIMDEPFQEEIIRKLKDVDTGAMYATARIEYALIDPIDYQVYINTSWLEKLNLKAPTTLDELHDERKRSYGRDPDRGHRRGNIRKRPYQLDPQLLRIRR